MITAALLGLNPAILLAVAQQADAAQYRTHTRRRPWLHGYLPFGSEINTPNIAELAASGVSFTNYHTAGSCAPARAMLLTGVDSHRNGVPNIPEALPT